MKKKKIPKFKNIAEEAKFWDTHDVTDYLGEMKFVDVEFVPRVKKEKVLTIRIESKLKDDAEKIARHHGLSLSSLMRMWFIEKLREYAKRSR